MKPLFTVHGGEFVVGSYIEENYKNYDVWVPSKDTGIDLLVTKKDDFSIKPKTIQVKSSKDYKNVKYVPQHMIKARSWFDVGHDKLKNSSAKYWVFVILDEKGNKNFIIIKKDDLLKKLEKSYGNIEVFRIYLTILELGKRRVCYDMRSLKKQLVVNIVNKLSKCPQERDYSNNLNAWNIIF